MAAVMDQIGTRGSAAVVIINRLRVGGGDFELFTDISLSFH